MATDEASGSGWYYSTKVFSFSLSENLSGDYLHPLLLSSPKKLVRPE